MNNYIKKHKYASKFRKLCSGHRNEKGQFQFQFQRKAMPKNAQTYTLVSNAQNSPRQASTVCEQCFQTFKLDLEKAEEPEIKLPTSVGSSKKQESSRNTSTSALLTMPKPLTVWITANWKILQKMGIPDHLTCLLRNLYAGQEAKFRTGHGTTDWFQIGKGVHQGCILSPCLFNLYASTS